MYTEIFLFIITILVTVSYIKKIKNSKNIINSSLIKDFESYISVLEYHMEKAFNIIFKERILVYSLDGLRVKEEEIDVITRDFCSLVIKILGPTLYQNFIFLYGNEKTLMINMINFFNTRYEDDQIRESSVNSIMEKDDTTK